MDVAALVAENLQPCPFDGQGEVHELTRDDADPDLGGTHAWYADDDGDGYDDLIAMVNPGTLAVVLGNPVAANRTQVEVAVPAPWGLRDYTGADLDGDGLAEVFASAGNGADSHWFVFEWSGETLAVVSEGGAGGAGSSYGYPVVCPGDIDLDGREVAVKIQYPDIEHVVRVDLRSFAILVRVLACLEPDFDFRVLIEEVEKYVPLELDFAHEADNAERMALCLRSRPDVLVPAVVRPLSTRRVLVLEYAPGVRVTDVAGLRALGVDPADVAWRLIDLFCEQVLVHGFFHADMHPGNIFVADDGRYIALDFGIMGTLTDVDKSYLAQNFLAFFNRDYRRVAQAHLDAGWAPAGTRLDAFEAAIRSVCEPIFARPLKEIFFGKLLLRLFQTSRRFNIEIQPQLVLLQKTLLNIEGLGRELDPDLDLWQTAKPYLERWMSERSWTSLPATSR